MSFELGSSELASALDRLYTAQAAFTTAKQQTVAACTDATRSTDRDLATRAEAVLNRLAKGRGVTHEIAHAEIDGHLRTLRDADAAYQKARKDALNIMATDQNRWSQRLIDYCKLPRFREALTWQNRSVLKNVVDRLAQATPDEHNYKARDRKLLVAKYVQRYSLKNDTIGFFGPVHWCRFDREVEGMELRPGPLTTQRWTFFEDWVVGALAEQMSFAAELFPICSLRIKPFSWIDGTTLYRPPAEPKILDEAEVLLLQIARDTHTIQDIVARAVESGAGLIESADHALALVKKLVKAGLAVSQIELPAEVGNKERHLRALLLAAPESEARSEALAQLDQLESDLAELQRAAGDPAALDRAIEQLEASFTRITARAVKRGHGQVYAGRQLFFEDCQRGGDLTMGRSLLDRIEHPLSLMLVSARWYTYEVARRYREAFTKRYRELARKEADKKVPLGAFLVGTADLFAHQNREIAPIVAEVQEELRRRWDRIIELDSNAKRVAIRSEDYRERVAELFRAPCPGWPTARYQAPDLMVAAANPEDISTGNFLAVMGELHAGVNTLLARCAFLIHPEREGVESACEQDVVSICITPVQPTADRTSTNVWAPNGLHVELDRSRSWRPRERVFAGGDLYVIEEDGALEVRSRTRDDRFDIVRFMDHYLSAEASPHFRVFRDAKHMPRVTLDNLVISRERWSLERQDFSMLLGDEGTREERFLVVNTWARDLGLPRFVFAVVPNEPKPFYLDLASPVYVEMFLKFVARAPVLQLSEMLPAHGEHWFECDEGFRYTSELRIAAIDPVPWSAAKAT